MKRFRVISLTITIGLAVIVMTGIIVQALSPQPFPAREVIPLLVSGISIVIALFEQVTSYRERKSYSKIIQELNEVIAESEAEKALEKTTLKKLDELLELDHRIYGRVNKKTKKKEARK